MDLMKWEGPGTRDLWDAFDSVRGELDNALDFFRLPEAAGIFDQARAPAIDLLEGPEDYELLVDLPGIERKDIEVTVAGNLLTIKGSKKNEAETGKRKFFRKEAWVGSFARTINLPDRVNTASVKAELKDGVLHVRLAKREEAKQKVVAIELA